MNLDQYYLDCLSHASYLIGDETTGRAVVVDPQRDVAEYLADAKELGSPSNWSINTHFHADFLSGHLELAKATGAKIVYSSVAETEFASRRASPTASAISLGEVDARVPPHPRAHPESLSDRGLRARRRRTSYGVLTGDAVHRRRRPAGPAGVDRFHP